MSTENALTRLYAKHFIYTFLLCVFIKVFYIENLRFKLSKPFARCKISIIEDFYQPKNNKASFKHKISTHNESRNRKPYQKQTHNCWYQDKRQIMHSTEYISAWMKKNSFFLKDLSKDIETIGLIMQFSILSSGSVHWPKYFFYSDYVL